MIVLRAQVWPGGDGTKAQDIGVAMIVNTSETDRLALADYHAQFVANPRSTGGQGGRQVNAVVLGYPRRDAGLCFWDLVYRLLKAAVGARNP